MIDLDDVTWPAGPVEGRQTPDEPIPQSQSVVPTAVKSGPGPLIRMPPNSEILVDQMYFSVATNSLYRVKSPREYEHHFVWVMLVDIKYRHLLRITYPGLLDHCQRGAWRYVGMSQSGTDWNGSDDDGGICGGDKTSWSTPVNNAGDNKPAGSVAEVLCPAPGRRGARD